MKKKLFFFATLLVAVVAAFGLSSCSQEDMPDSPNREGEVDVVLTTSLPQSLQSYAISSDKSGLENLEGEEGLYVRYIMEVYNKTTSTEPVVRKICYKPLVSGGDYKTASFQTRLVAAQYNFVFWADIVREVNTMENNSVDMSAVGLSKPFYGNRYFLTNQENPDGSEPVLVHATNADTYSAGTLQEISANVQADASVGHITGEMYDGYTANEVIDLRSEPTGKSITLKRPFAKLRVITTDADVLKEQGIDPSTINMSLLYGTTIPSTYNALTKASSGIANLNALYKNNAIYDDETDPKVKTVGVMYCLIPASVDNMELSLGVKGSSIYDAISINVENVPLVANKLTTIKGNLFARNPKITINIDDEFEDDEIIIENKEVATIDDLKNALNGKDQIFTYTGKVTKEDGFNLDFSTLKNELVTYSSESTLYPEGNKAKVIIKFTDIDENAVLTFTASNPANAPKELIINNGSSKCSVRVKSVNTFVTYAGSYKYLVYDGLAVEGSPCSVDAMFVVNETGGFFYPENTFHSFVLTNDFKLMEGGCNNFDHECAFLTNTGLTVGTDMWEYVVKNK